MSPEPPQEPFYVGDEWFIEDTVTNPVTGAPAEPNSVTAAVYKPSEWDSVHDVATGIGKNVALAQSKAGSNLYVNAAGVALSEAGIWRAVITTTAPFVGVKTTLITVQPVGEL